MRTAVLGVRVVISIVIGRMVAERQGAVTAHEPWLSQP